MQRHREIAGSPVRTASETWDAVGDLVLATLTRSPAINGEDVRSALTAAAPAATMLIAAGHLATDPAVLQASELDLQITVVAGDKAFDVEENDNPVPGAAQATDWTLHLPTPDPLGPALIAMLDGVPHVAAGLPGEAGPASSASAAHEASSSMLNLAALKQRGSSR